MSKDLDLFEDDLTEEEKKFYNNKYKNLRKVSILKNIPFEKWSKEELLDLIEEYDFYIMIENSKNKEDIYQFQSLQQTENMKDIHCLKNIES